MKQGLQHLDYRAEPRLRRNGRWWFTIALAAVSAMIYGLRVLETMPYRPPHDMSTALGGPELAFVRLVIVLMCIVWCVLLVGLVVSLRPRARAA